MAAPVLNLALLRRAAKAPGASAFPFLKPFSKKVRPGCCGRTTAAPDPRAAIAAVGLLPPDRLAAFKALVGVPRLTVWVVRAARMTRVEI